MIQHSSSERLSGSAGGNLFNPPFATHSSRDGRLFSGNGGVLLTSEELKRCSYRRYRYSRTVTQAVKAVIGRKNVTRTKPRANRVKKNVGFRDLNGAQAIEALYGRKTTSPMMLRTRHPRDVSQLRGSSGCAIVLENSKWKSLSSTSDGAPCDIIMDSTRQPSVATICRVSQSSDAAWPDSKAHDEDVPCQETAR